jgi:hypothetical protein
MLQVRDEVHYQEPILLLLLQPQEDAWQAD